MGNLLVALPVLPTFTHPKNCIIPTEAAHNLIVSGAVEEPALSLPIGPHFTFAVCSCSCFLVVILRGAENLLLFLALQLFFCVFSPKIACQAP
jgi:hypothetical protein